jgi:hypothetical protein
VDRYRAELADVRENRLHLADENLDTGLPTKPGAYRLADRAYTELLNQLAKDHFAGLTPDLRRNMLTFFAAAGPLPEKEAAQLEELKRAQSSPAPLPPPLPKPYDGDSAVPPM